MKDAAGPSSSRLPADDDAKPEQGGDRSKDEPLIHMAECRLRKQLSGSVALL